MLVEQVPPGAVLGLRQRVLRPGQSLADARFDGDGEGRHFAAFTAEGAIVGVASLLLEPRPGEQEAAWRLRGMAVEELWRRRGVGARLLDAVMAQVVAEGGGLLWCTARVGVVGFYRGRGFRPISSTFEIAGIGPHVEMAVELAGP